MEYSVLIQQLIAQDYLKTPLIIDAFKHIRRGDFLPEDLRGEAGVDAPLPIGFGQTNSQPLTVAFMLELLQPQPGDKILDIGAGSGWTSALLAWCVSRGDSDLLKSDFNKSRHRQRDGKVFAIERIPQLCEFGKNNIAKYNFINKGVVEFFCADGNRGLAQKAPFDKILASASARFIPAAWKKQLKVGGRIVAPVGNSIFLFIKQSARKFIEREFLGFSFVPLVEEENVKIKKQNDN